MPPVKGNAVLFWSMVCFLDSTSYSTHVLYLTHLSNYKALNPFFPLNKSRKNFSCFDFCFEPCSHSKNLISAHGFFFF